MANTIVIIVDPNVCPVNRAVLCIPPAAPVRSTGVAITITILLGVWKKPNPIPQIAIRQTISHSPALDGKNIKNNKPTAKIIMPDAAVNPGLCFSINRAASGEIIIVANGHGVMTNPVESSDNLKPVKKRNGKAIVVRFCDMNEQTDVNILVE